MALQHLRSSTADKRPTPAAMSDGQLALNTNLASPGLFFKDSNGDSVKIGPVHVGTTAPNVTPGAGGQAGNSKGEAWLDTTATNPILKVWNGSAFVAVQPVGTGTVVSTTDTGTVTSTMILDGTILNADINASAAIVDTKLATIATAGKVSNSATTATNANTASAIVARDGSGNFTAGTITAALTGAASSNVLKAGDTMTGALVVPLASAATPSLTFTGDLNTGIFSPGADQVAVATNGVGRLFVDASGNVAIAQAPSNAASFTRSFNISALDASIALRGSSGGTYTDQGIFFAVDGVNYSQIYNDGIGQLIFRTGSGLSERLRIDSSGRLLIGSSSSISTLVQPYLQIHGTGENAFISANRWSNDEFGTALILGKSRGGAVGTRGAVSNGDSLGEIIFAGDNGSSFSTGGSITCAVDGAVSGGGAGDMPSRMSFNTTPDGTQTPVERMRIRSDGNVGIGTVGIANIRLYTVGSDTSASSFTYYGTNSVGTQIFSVRNDGAFNTGVAALSPYNLVSGLGANLYVDAAGFLYRSTSSARFKTDIQTLEDSYADALLDVRPVWYRSVAPGDTTHPDWGYWGFIAEEVAEIDPRLVFWKTHETQKDEDNNDIQVELEEPLAEGVQYDRFVPHLLNLIKRQQQAIETLEVKVAALESA